MSLANAINLIRSSGSATSREPRHAAPISCARSFASCSLIPVLRIAIRPFGKGYWGKLDAKIPYDWEGEKWLPTAEVQLGYNFNETLAGFVEALIGIGKDRPYDGGGGLGLRLKY